MHNMYLMAQNYYVSSAKALGAFCAHSYWQQQIKKNISLLNKKDYTFLQNVAFWLVLFIQLCGHGMRFRYQTEKFSAYPQSGLWCVKLPEIRRFFTALVGVVVISKITAYFLE